MAKRGPPSGGSGSPRPTGPRPVPQPPPQPPIKIFLSRSQKTDGNWVIVASAHKAGKPEAGVSFIFIQNGSQKTEQTDSKGVCTFNAVPGKLEIHTPEKQEEFNLEPLPPPKKPPISYPAAPSDMNPFLKPVHWFWVRFTTKNDNQNNFRAKTFWVVWIFWMMFNIFAIGIGPNKPLFPTSISASAETRKADTAEKRKNLAERGQFKTDQELAGKKEIAKTKSSWFKKTASTLSWWLWLLSIVAIPILLIYTIISFKEEAGSAISKAFKGHTASSASPNPTSGGGGKHSVMSSIGKAFKFFLEEITIAKFFRRWL
ncbi:MAG: hypothetical protein AAB501_00725 [Patescibacteria group bacterium]